MSSGATCTPLRPASIRKPSRRRSIIACKTGWRLTPNFCASSSWVSRVPAFSSPEQMASRTASWMRSLRSGSGRKARMVGLYTEHRAAGVNELAGFQALFRSDGQPLFRIIWDQPVNFLVDQPDDVVRRVDRPGNDLQPEFVGFGERLRRQVTPERRPDRAAGRFHQLRHRPAVFLEIQ